MIITFNFLVCLLAEKWVYYTEGFLLIFVFLLYEKINLEKVQERWWEAVLVDEPKISVRKIDPSRPITDLDDEAQAKIEELMYNEHQKRLGLPQSHEKVSTTVQMFFDKKLWFMVCF